MDQQNSPSQLQEAVQPYLEKGYEVVNATDTSAELFKPKKKMGWWVAVLDTGGYARNRDRTVYFTVAETGGIEITGVNRPDALPAPALARPAPWSSDRPGR